MDLRSWQYKAFTGLYTSSYYVMICIQKRIFMMSFKIRIEVGKKPHFKNIQDWFNITNIHNYHQCNYLCRQSRLWISREKAQKGNHMQHRT